jgi:SAM-dependent methyltransferase
MRRYTAETYGDVIADIYDDLMAPIADSTADAADFLAKFASGGRALELGIGTGRVALPLADRGVRVHGIDASTKMLERLRGKPGGAAVGTTVGDFADVVAPGTFDLVYIVFNTIYGLLTQERQIDCVRNVAAKLRPGGTFVVEAFIPNVCRVDHRDALADDGQARLDVTRHDPVTQLIDARQVLHTPAGIRLLPVHMRYIWPSELDLMTRLAGLRLVDRFAGWNRQPLTAASRSHVSVYADFE